MKKSVSLEKIYDAEIVSQVRNSSYIRRFPDVIIAPKRRLRNTIENCSEIYSIIIKPKLYRSSSLSELTTNCSDSSFCRQTNSISIQRYSSKSFYEQSGDAVVRYCSNCTPYNRMPRNYKAKSHKKRLEMGEDSYGSKFAAEFARSTQLELEESNPESSMESSDQGVEKTPTFPFKETPSGNLKVQSNQVVYQSSTVGVVLADPTQAQVQVKYESKAGGEPDDDSEFNDSPRLSTCPGGCGRKTKVSGVKGEKEKDLESLGYAMVEPVDWLRVQLPKKQDLYQEFCRRIHNYVNTDTIVHIGDEEFHCHHIVLEVYSGFFNDNTKKDITLPVDRVTPQAFQTIYEWMIFSGPESNRALKRDNILALFCAAQFLAIKDLEDQCWAFILNESLINEDTAFVLFREARAMGIKAVTDLMVPRVQRFFLPLVASKDFITLELDEIVTFLKSNYICVSSEIEVLMAGVRWLHGNWQERRRHAADVMRCVRFGLISPWQLVDIKRNPDNGEILEIVNDGQVQQMVDDGLAYVIIKYWYGNTPKNYNHWIDVLGLTEPAERNWIGEETNHVTYKEFLKYLEQFLVPKEQMYHQMAMMQPPRRTDDISGGIRMDCDKMDLRRPKTDLPLSGLPSDKDKNFPAVSELLMDRRMNPERSRQPAPGEPPSSAPRDELALQMKRMKNVLRIRGAQKAGGELPNDMENYMRYHIMGFVNRIMLKPGCLPSKFECQTDRKRGLPMPSTVTSSPTANKRQRHAVIQEALEDYKLKSKAEEENTTLFPSLQTDVVVPEHKPKSEDKGLQVHVKNKYFRSKWTQTNNEIRNIATSPSKTWTKTISTSPFKVEEHVKLATPSVSNLNKFILVDRSDSDTLPGSQSTSSYQPSSPSVQSLQFKLTSSSTLNELEAKVDKERNAKLALDLMCEKIMNKPRLYIGITSECYYLVDLISKHTKIPSTHILLCLKKIRMNTTFSELGDQFGMSTSYAGKIFRNNIPLIANVLKPFIVKLDKEKNKKCMPIAFRHHYSKVTCIIDCFEIEIEKPSKSVHQALTWSEYKKGNTIKYLISSTPNGLVNYISSGYGGRITDTLLVESCGFLDQLEPESWVLADRGFKHIEQLLSHNNCHLLRPPSVIQGTKLSKREAHRTKQIASLRIHIERLIRRIREYSMLKPHSVLNSKLICVLDECVTIACALVNLQASIIQ